MPAEPVAQRRVQQMGRRMVGAGRQPAVRIHRQAHAGAGQQGDTCASSADCAPKLNCFNTTNPTGVKCLENCKASAPNGCPAGTTCKFFATPELLGGEEYGACL